MKYSLANSKDFFAARAYLGKLREKKVLIELKEVKAQRSLRSNAYLHLLLQICASEWGYTLEEMKMLWKRQAASIFVYHKNDIPFTRSSADLDSKEMADAIESLKKYAAEQGLDLPEPDDKEKLAYYEHQIDKRNL